MNEESNNAGPEVAQNASQVESNTGAQQSEQQESDKSPSTVESAGAGLKEAFAQLQDKIKATECDRAEAKQPDLATVLIDESHAFTSVFAEDYRTVGGAHSRYAIKTKEGEILARLSFQDGAIKEAGVNGVMVEDLLAIVIDRLEGFQAGPYACEENAGALIKAKSALKYLQDRTKAREARGVEGTHKV